MKSLLLKLVVLIMSVSVVSSVYAQSLIKGRDVKGKEGNKVEEARDKTVKEMAEAHGKSAGMIARIAQAVALKVEPKDLANFERAIKDKAVGAEDTMKFMESVNPAMDKLSSEQGEIAAKIASLVGNKAIAEKASYKAMMEAGLKELKTQVAEVNFEIVLKAMLEALNAERVKAGSEVLTMSDFIETLKKCIL